MEDNSLKIDDSVSEKEDQYQDFSMNDYIRLIFDSFLEIHGDRKSGDDATVICGLASLDSYKVVVIGHQSSQVITSPAGYRKGLRLINIAEDFNKPVIVLIGAANFLSLATHNQQTNEAIARYIERMSSIMVPSIGVILNRNAGISLSEMCVLDRVINVDNNASDDSLEAISDKLRGSILEELDQLAKMQLEVLVERRLRTVISKQ